jgi:hypothetical protein
MRRPSRLLTVGAGLALVLGLSTTAALADPEDHTDSHGGFNHDGEPPESPPFVGAQSKGMPLVGNSDKDGTTNSDLAFWGDLAFAGNYNGFRILDVSDPANTQVISDYYCRGPQNDVSVAKAGDRLLLFQSIDSAQTKESCDGTVAGSSADNPIIRENGESYRSFGFEGIRMYDVTDPANPVFLDGIQTACGSHTHTVVPNEAAGQLHLYVSSYPLGTGRTAPSQVDEAGENACVTPHQKISVVDVPLSNPEGWSVRQVPLSDGTAENRGFKACHDVQAFLPNDVAIGACAGDAQLWDISDPAHPDTMNATHIVGPTEKDQFEFIHSGVVTWDGKYFAILDETGGGGSSECDGPPDPEGTDAAGSEHGFYYFYKMVEPGAPAPELESRYMIPRAQGTQICVSHNANVVPVDGRYLMSAAYYQGGNTIVDFTDVNKPEEVAYSDLTDPTGSADSWSTYWYNNRVYANGGLNRQGATGNRGLDIFNVILGGRLKAKQFAYMNPQTQEGFQQP